MCFVVDLKVEASNYRKLIFIFREKNKEDKNKNEEFCNNIIELLDNGIYKTLIKNMQLYQFCDIEESCDETN